MSENSQRLRLGIIGLGGMGTDMLDAATGHPDVVVTSAADVNAELVARYREQRPGIAFGTDPHAVIAAELDALYIATPPVHHAELVLSALSRGIPVMCEKPLAVDLAEGAAMVSAAQAAGLACAVNYSLSDRQAVLEVERALTAGAVGDVVGVEVQLRFPTWPRGFQAGAAWVGTRAQGGFVREVFSHFVYLTDRLLGPLSVVSAQAHYATAGAETAALGHFRAGDTPVSLTGWVGLAGEECYDWTLWGTECSYQLRDWEYLYRSDGGPWSPVPLPAVRGDDATRLSRFARAVRGEHVTDLADFADAYRVQQVVEAILGGAR